MKTKKISPLSYAFAVGKIRALEKFLIKQAVFEQAIESDLAGALRLFVESDLYGERLLHVKDSQQLEAVLKEASLKLKKLISNLLLDKELISLIESDSLRCLENISKIRQSEFLQDYFLHLADMHNIKTFLRLYILKAPGDELKKQLLYEGFIKKEAFLKLYAQDLSVFLNHLEYVHKHNQLVDYASFLREAVQKLQAENSFVSLEKAINDFLIQILKPAKYLCFGPEPLLAYYFAKVNEIELIRLIILAKINSLANDLVKERLNTVYA